MNTTDRQIQFDFSGQCAVITGGAQGIGLTISEKLLQAGARVSIWDHSQTTLDIVKARLAQHLDSVRFQQVDVSDKSQCLRGALELPWKIDLLVNNAGITRDRTFAKMSDEDFDSVIATNLTGVYNVTKALLPHFTDSKDKRIINMSSLVGLLGNFGQTNYAASKAGLIGFTKSLARELGAMGFSVNAIAPGFIKTPMTEKVPKEILQSIAKRVPVGRLGETEDVANLCLFLCAKESGYINGSVVSVDGGLTI
ncbi:MAG: 3-oxoacyl-ACP reductase FabG [Bdellovibrionales bacterium]